MGLAEGQSERETCSLPPHLPPLLPSFNQSVQSSFRFRQLELTELHKLISDPPSSGIMWATEIGHSGHIAEMGKHML